MSNELGVANQSIIRSGTDDQTKSAESSNRRVQSREWRFIFLVTLPLILLLVCFAVDAVNALTAKSDVRQYVTKKIAKGEPVNQLDLIERFADMTSRDQTLQWASLLEASFSFESDPEHGVSPRWQSLAIPSAAANDDDLAKRGQTNIAVLDYLVQREAPLREARRALLAKFNAAGEKPVWLPFQWNPSNYYPTPSTMWSAFKSQDNRAFRSAIAHGRNDQALEILHTLDDTARQFSYEVYSPETRTRVTKEVMDLIGISLAVADWDDEQLLQLRRFVQSPPDYIAMFKQQRDYRLASGLESMNALDDQPAIIENNMQRGGIKAVLPKQTIRQWVQFLQTTAHKMEPGGVRTLADYQWSWPHFPRRMQAEALSLASIPFGTATVAVNQFGGDLGWATMKLATYEIQRRWLLTAITIKQYYDANHAWPQQLSELQSMGLSQHDWELMPGVEFGYQDRPLLERNKPGNEVVLWVPNLNYRNLKATIQKFGITSTSPPRSSEGLGVYEMEQILIVRDTRPANLPKK